MPLCITGMVEEEKSHEPNRNGGCHDLENGKVGEQELAHDHVIAGGPSLLQEKSEHDAKAETENYLGFFIVMQLAELHSRPAPHRGTPKRIIAMAIPPTKKQAAERMLPTESCRLPLIP